MLISNLLSNVCSYISEQDLDFREDNQISEIQDIEFSEDYFYFYHLSLLNFDSLDFFAPSAKKNNCKKGYPCKSICLNVAKNCLNPIQGQAKSYAAWLQMQSTATTKKTASKPAAAVTPQATTPTTTKKTAGKPATAVTPQATTPTTTDKAQVKTNQVELDQKRNDLINEYGAKTVQNAEKNVQKIMDDPDTNVYIRVGSASTLQLILDGRFKTAHELGRTQHDIPNLKDDYLTARARVEKKSLGYDEKTLDADRPIYGYMGGKDLSGRSHEDVGDAYGSIAVRLKSEVKDRATFTGADTFKSGIASEVKTRGTPPPPNAASLVASTRHGYDKDNLPPGYPGHYANKSDDKNQLISAAKAKSIDELTPALSPTGNAYVEAQIHGKVTAKDIAEIHFQPKGVEDRPTAAIAQFAKDNKVGLFVEGKKLEESEIDNLISPKVSPITQDGQSKRLKDLSVALEKGDFDEVAKHTEKIYADAQKIALAEGERDGILKQLYKESGYDRLPQVKTSQEMDVLAKQGAVMACRGLSTAPFGQRTASEMAEDYRRGDYFVGNGIYGNGTYVAHTGSFSKDKSSFIAKSTPETQKSAWEKLDKSGYVKDDTDGKAATLRMALNKDAVVVTATTMQKETDSLAGKIDAWESAAIVKLLGNLAPDSKKAYDDYQIGVGKKPIRVTEENGKINGIPMVKNTHIFKDKSSDTGKMEVEVIGTLTGQFYSSNSDGRQVLLKAKSSGQALKEAKANMMTERGLKKVMAGKDKPVRDKANRMRQVLGITSKDDDPPGDNGDGTSGRYAVIKGYDAVALDNSYEPNTFMNILNRSKTFVQDTNLSYNEGKRKGVGL